MAYLFWNLLSSMSCITILTQSLSLRIGWSIFTGMKVVFRWNRTIGAIKRNVLRVEVTDSRAPFYGDIIEPQRAPLYKWYDYDNNTG